MESNSRALTLEMNGKEKEMVHQKKWASNLFMKFWRVSDDRIVAGSLFCDAGPATANTQSPQFVFERGTWRLPCAAEQSQERAVSSAFDQQSSLRYSDAVPWTALKTRRQSLYPTHSGTRSQWSSLSHSRRDTGVSRPERQTSRAAAFITLWSRFRARCKLL